MRLRYLSTTPVLAMTLAACGNYDDPVDKTPSDNGWVDIGEECSADACVKQIHVFDRNCIVLDGRGVAGISCDWPNSAPSPESTP